MSEKVKIIFLDFDGVITTPDSKWAIDNEKVSLIEKIIKETGSKIVVSSSWRSGCTTSDEFRNKLFKIRTTRACIDRDSLFINSIIGVTGHGGGRGAEIQKWLDEHSDSIDNYVIIDDEGPMLDEQLFNFVQTDGMEGISEREVKLAIKVLNREKIFNPFRLNCDLMIIRHDNFCGRESNYSELYQKYLRQWKK